MSLQPQASENDPFYLPPLPPEATQYYDQPLQLQTIGNEYFFPQLPPEVTQTYDRLFSPVQDYNPDYFDEFDYSGQPDINEGLIVATLEKFDEPVVLDVDIIASLDHFLSKEKPTYNDTAIQSAAQMEHQPDLYNAIMSKLFPDEGFVVVSNCDPPRPVPRESMCANERYLMVMCFFTPAIFSDSAVRATSAACSELLRDKAVQVVVVVKMRNDWVDNEAAFNQFLSGFPAGVLKIPFTDSDSSDFISYILGLESSEPVGALLNLRTKRVMWHKSLSFFKNYGVDAFPYTDEFIEVFDDQDEGLQLSGIVPFKDLFPSTPVLSSLSDPRLEATFSSLNGTVIIYLCLGGTIHPKLLRIQEDCRARNKPFEVVLAFPPVTEISNYDFFNDLVTRMGPPYTELHKSWWVLPGSSSMRLWRLCKSLPYIGDRLISLGPRGSSADTHAADFLLTLGHQGWPFFRNLVIKTFVDEMSKLTLEDFLGTEIRGHYLEPMPVANLHGKDMILFLVGEPFANSFDVYVSLVRNYDKIKKKNPGLEVVVVPLVDEIFYCAYRKLGWLMSSFDAQRANTVARRLFLKRKCSTLVVFGKDGIGSIYAQDYLDSGCEVDFPFKGDLEEEVFAHFAEFSRHHGFQFETDTFSY